MCKEVNNLIYGVRYLKFDFMEGQIKPELAEKSNEEDNSIFEDLKRISQDCDYPIDSKLEEEFENYMQILQELEKGYLRSEYSYYPFSNFFKEITMILPCTVKEKEDSYVIYDILTREIVAQLSKKEVEGKEKEVIERLNLMKDFRIIKETPYTT